jgi:hypothetical protein
MNLQKKQVGGTHVGTDANCAGGVWAEFYADLPGRICEHKVVNVSVRNLEGSVLYMSHREQYYSHQRRDF